MAPKKTMNPRGKVFSFRADREMTELITLAAAKGNKTISEFLQQAAKNVALSETLRANVSDRLWKEA